MDIIGEYTFDLPQDLVWDVLRSPKVLASIIPLVSDMKQLNETEYMGYLFFRVGSVAGTFQGKIALFNIDERHSYDITVRGSSSIGDVNMTGQMRLEPASNRTIMFYKGNINFGGRIASVGSRMLEIATRAIVNQSFDTLSKYLAVKYKIVS